MSRAALLTALAAVLAAPSAARACDGAGEAAAPAPGCEGGNCSARTLLRDVDLVLRRAEGCREPKAQKPARPVLLETLQGPLETPVLPDTARLDAHGGILI